MAPARSQRVRTILALLHALHVCALGLWGGVLVGTGLFAAIVFPTVRDLAPTLPSHASFTGEHWMLLAGRVAGRVFIAADAVAFVCALLAIVTIVAGLMLLAAGPRRPGGPFGGVALGWRAGTIVRAFALAAAVGLLAFQLLVLGPRMSALLATYWSQAEAGNSQAALAARAEFMNDHPTASLVMSLTALSVLASLFTAAFLGAAPPPGRPEASPAATGPADEAAPALEPPALLRGRR